jgi:hypothetical protein
LSGEFGVYRFTAPAAGQYSLAWSFVGADLAGATTDAHVLVNNSSIFDGNVNGFGPGSGPSFTTTLTLAVGDRVDFAVGFGTDGGPNNDATGISAQLSAVPEPSTLALASLGGLGVLGYGWRRRRRTGR